MNPLRHLLHAARWGIAFRRSIPTRGAAAPSSVPTEKKVPLRGGAIGRLKPIHQLLALLLASVAQAAPIFTPATTTYGGIAEGGLFITGGIGTAGSTNNWPAAEPPSKLVNGSIGGAGDKHLNFAITNTAVVFASSTARVADRMQIWVANDSMERDPATYQLYGTNSAIPFLFPGFPLALSTFTLISSGELSLPIERNTTNGSSGFSQVLSFQNTMPYASYLLVFPTVTAWSFQPPPTAMQISEVQLYDSAIAGVEQFDYPDGPAAGNNGGTFWNYRNIAPVSQTGAASNWDNVFNAPAIVSGRLSTQNSAAKREYSGDESAGAVNPAKVHRAVYYRVTATTGAAVPAWFGLSSYDFGAERLFFGKSTGQAKFGIEESGGSISSATNTPDIQPNTAYTLVARLDFEADTLRLYVNPVLNATESSQTPAATRSYTGTNWSTAVRLASGSGLPVLWDDLVVATAWEDLGTVVDTTGVGLNVALKYSPPGSLITFAPELSGQTLTFEAGGGVIDRTFTIDASALPGGLTIAGNGTRRHFYVNSGKSLTLRGLTLTGGNGTGINSGLGGAIFNDGTLSLMQCTLSGNAASQFGGAIYNDGTLTMTQCTLSGNAASRDAGAIYNNTSSALTMTQCTLSGNASQRGGAIYSVAPLTLTQCTLSGNTTSNDGGAIYSSGMLTLTHCTLSGNSAQNGGALLNTGTPLELRHCTLSGNTGSGFGGAIVNSTGNLILINSIVAGNALTGTGSGADIYNQGAISRQGRNLVQVLANSVTGSNSGPAHSTDAPRLSPLGYFGGPVQTMHPLIGSPAIDAIATIDPEGTDARGFPRFADGDASFSAQLDIGAVEAGPLSTVATAVDEINGVTNGFSLREILASNPSAGTRIGFSSSQFPATATVTLALGQLNIPPTANGLFIDASNLTGPVTVSGNNPNPNPSRVFNIPSTATVAMHSVRIVNGKSADGAPGVDGVCGGGHGDAGGGILNDGRLSLFSCTLSGNTSGGGGAGGGLGGNGGHGGAIHSTGLLTLTACTLSGNTAGSGGVGTGNGGGIGGDGGNGGAIHSTGPLTLTACTLSGNNAGHAGNGSGSGGGGKGGSGGGIRCTGPLTLTACTIAANQSGNGGGGFTAGAQGSGGGIFATDALLQHCLISQNTGLGTAKDVNVTGLTVIDTARLTTVGANLLGTAANQTPIGPAPTINPNPHLAPLGDYGGPTWTMALRPGSPARNAATGGPSTPTDQRGFPIAASSRDIGAYEAGNGLFTNYNAFIWETLPNTATPAQADAAFDFDFDGSGNGEEFLAGTTVADHNSVFRPAASRNGGFLIITFPTITGRTYRLQTSETLSGGSWITDISSARAGNGSDQSYSIPTTSITRRFFRVDVSQ